MFLQLEICAIIGSRTNHCMHVFILLKNDSVLGKKDKSNIETVLLYI